MIKNITTTIALTAIAIIVLSFMSKKTNRDLSVKNIVLVHGAFLDGSGWESVYNILTEKGYHVSVSQHKLQSLETDVAEVNRIIDQQTSPCILVGHSYGGVIISQAGNNNKVSGLVYIAAHAPEANEKRSELFRKYPPSYTSLIKGEDGYDYIDPERFPEDFAADLPIRKAKFMANSQMPTADICFQGLIDNPAWKIKPTWYMVAKSDRIINPDLELFYAQRMKAKKIVEIGGGSHSIYTSRPNEVANLIDEAAKALSK
ncbi:alpha/beta fold hydrolase [Chryseobacterium daecheongense]|uniref:Alpha/beta hydrolase n=1 Tax=Chryseobacterium daecheongense TaxID=192389 RepID=A0A3N0W5D7_9FLAO|nr:alpha/beta hydrolase [Chryseobacterium daecheongense]ROI00272.1 alpha/beta hydrolase [Chryseobacterium daecheongense]TDX94769.1 pimeloyl-ACP methyl ester carboxylesterase [Chryseobacterium daecheongense]